MTTLGTFLIAGATLLLTALGLIAKQDVNIEVRKFLTWVVIVTITLLFPSYFVSWLTMQIAARIFAFTNIDLSLFTTNVSWWTGSVSMIYPLIWGIWLYPKIKIYVRDKILVIPNARKVKNRSDNSKA